MRNKYVLEVIKEYEQQQEQVKVEHEKKLSEIYRKFPKIKQIDDSISRLGFDIAASIFKGINIESYISEQKKKILDLKTEKAEVLASNGYPVDYLEMKYTCSLCNDTGYIENRKCNCFKQKLINKYYNQSNLKDLLQKEHFDNFDMSLYSTGKYENELVSPQKNMEEILTHCMTFSNNFENSYENLFFYGNSGLGKTFLSNCIAKDLLDKGKVVIYQTASSLMEILRSSKFGESQDSFEGKLQDILNCDLLIIDDLGTEPNTGFSQSELYNIINARLLAQKQMIISTNFPLSDLRGIYPERITSRIFGNFVMFKFYGEDIRVKKNITKRKAR
jgi:DNA replication protein DnaC